MRLILLPIILLTSLTTWAQSRYMVYFTDKNSTPYTVSNPAQFLSSRSIDRRTRFEIPVTILDLPVDPIYIDQVASTGATVYYASRWLNGVMVLADNSQLTDIAQLAFVSSTELISSVPPPGGRLEAKFELDDSSSESSFVQNNVLGTDRMHDDGYYGEGKIIAVLDTGFPGVDNLFAFQQIMDNGIVDCWDFVRNDAGVYDGYEHGTKVLSVMGAKLENEFTGVATGSTYALYSTEDINIEQPVEMFNMVIAMERADSVGADIITTSLGYVDWDPGFDAYSWADLDGNKSPISRAAQWCAERGIVFITSAGNAGSSEWQKITLPADCIDCLSVGSITATGTLSSFSSRGPTADGRIKPDVVVMGSGVKVIGEQGSISVTGGTSLAAPQVAGLVAGFWQRFPDLSNLEIIDIFRGAADRAAFPDNDYGYGLPHYSALVNYMMPPVQNMAVAVYPNPVSGDHFSIRVQDPVELPDIHYKITNMKGQLLQEGDLSFTWQNHTSQVPVYDIGQGLYVLTITMGGNSLKHRIMIR